MLKILRWLPCIALSVCLSATNASRAGIIPIDPFVGTSSEDFDNTGVEGATQTLDVFGGLATIRNLTSGGALKVELSSSLDGDLVVPRSAPWMVGQLGIAEWTFAQPISQFGGYFENNSRFDDAVVDFYDRSGSLIDSLTATIPKDAQDWTWNGWHSDTPHRAHRHHGERRGLLPRLHLVRRLPGDLGPDRGPRTGVMGPAGHRGSRLRALGMSAVHEERSFPGAKTHARRAASTVRPGPKAVQRKAVATGACSVDRG